MPGPVPLQGEWRTSAPKARATRSPRSRLTPAWGGRTLRATCWPSGSTELNYWVEALELDPGVRCGELPMHLAHRLVALVLPQRHLVHQHPLVRDPAIQTLPRQHT